MLQKPNLIKITANPAEHWRAKEDADRQTGDGLVEQRLDSQQQTLSRPISTGIRAGTMRLPAAMGTFCMTKVSVTVLERAEVALKKQRQEIPAGSLHF